MGVNCNKGGDKPPASRAFTHAAHARRSIRGKTSGAAGKENRGKNATSPPAAGPKSWTAPKAAET